MYPNAAAPPAPPTTSAETRLGEILGERYRLDAVVARGGFGTVYSATELGLNRRVAVKMLHPETLQVPEVQKRAQLEAVMLSRVSHPNVVAIHGSGWAATHEPYLAMEYVEGRSLAEAIDVAGPLPFWRIHDLARQLVRAVRAVHRQGVLHRDLKPQNLMLAQDPDRFGWDQVKLIDFGIAQLLSDSRAARSERRIAFTAPGTVIGSLNYMSPEQLFDRVADERSDLYAVGVIIYEMVAGRTPYPQTTVAEVMQQHALGPLPPIAAVGYRRRCPTELERVILRCLAEDRAARHGSADELARELDRLVDRFEPRDSHFRDPRRSAA